jgi:ABC-type siderophore export system fused ATPase/permease subunit
VYSGRACTLLVWQISIVGVMVGSLVGVNLATTEVGGIIVAVMSSGGCSNVLGTRTMRAEQAETERIRISATSKVTLIGKRIDPRCYVGKAIILSGEFYSILLTCTMFLIMIY